ncbi:hypothetical protein [Falsiroseomonas oryzae]|uniref:hypothetical protein n=1 Tax=Falsiroseomonas oryzae TaxID=2766473 RepID=UPI0022EAB394|nr:hypothetical protein [Roseomonas sp. MO-31]
MMDDAGAKTAFELRALADKCVSLASKLPPGPDRDRLLELATIYEAEAATAWIVKQEMADAAE